MDNILIALLVSLGLSGWVYAKMMRRTGSNTKTALITVAVAAIICFFFIWSITVMVDSALSK